MRRLAAIAGVFAAIAAVSDIPNQLRSDTLRVEQIRAEISKARKHKPRDLSSKRGKQRRA